jgi:SAM-dependent methyltransferase
MTKASRQNNRDVFLFMVSENRLTGKLKRIYCFMQIKGFNSRQGQMSSKSPIPFYQWILNEFTLPARAGFVRLLAPLLEPLIHPSIHALDLGCGAGPFAFYLEAKGAKVTAIDFDPEMFRLARQEAQMHRSEVDFILADVLIYEYSKAEYDLVVLLGNTLADFSLKDLSRLGQKVKKALKSEGKFVIHYRDELSSFINGTHPRETVQQKTPRRIVCKFKEYLPEQGAYVETYRDEQSGVEIEHTTYLHSPMLVEFALSDLFLLEKRIRLKDQSYLDVYGIASDGLRAEPSQ